MKEKKECKCGGDCKCKKSKEKEIQNEATVESCGEGCACKTAKELEGPLQPQDVTHIKDFHENFASQLLIKAHCIGAMRDESDFETVKYHIEQTLAFAKDIILNIEGTNEEKVEFIDKIQADIKKFNTKK